MAKNVRSVIENGLRQLLTVFNDDQYFKLAQISFSKKFDHFVDRVLERNIDYTEVLTLLKRVIVKHKCELIYCCYLEDAPLRVNLKNDKMVIGLTLHVDEEGIHRLRLRTIVENFSTRFDSRISTFVLTE